MVPGDATCTEIQEIQKDIMPYCPYASLVMFDSRTVSELGLPSEKHGGMRAWIDAATKLSMIYVGGATYPGRAIDSVPMQASAITPMSGPVLPFSYSVRMNVLVVLEGQNDKTTGPIFRDIAGIVRDGLRNLGHPTRVVYCANLVTDACFVSGEQVIVLAPHNLANYVTLEGALVVLERKLIPSDASESNCIFLSPMIIYGQSFYTAVITPLACYQVQCNAEIFRELTLNTPTPLFSGVLGAEWLSSVQFRAHRLLLATNNA